MPRYSSTERIGVNAVERIVLDDLGWIFREQPIEDMGIDAHVEHVRDGTPDGKLIALQIKTGSSHFKEKGDSFRFYGKTGHLDYWTGHSLPVLLIAHLPDSGQTFWQVVSETTVQRTRRGWRIDIPKANNFGKSSIDKVGQLFEGTPEQQRFRKLVIDEPLMRHINEGGKVSVGLEVWVNKSLGRTPVKVYIYDKSGDEILEREWFQFYTGYRVRDLVIALFPWCRPFVDEEFYECNSEDYGEDDSRHSLTSNAAVMYPYSEEAGEVEYFRLELKLSELGRAFLVVSDYISEGKH